jgi:hypothetical protein
MNRCWHFIVQLTILLDHHHHWLDSPWWALAFLTLCRRATQKCVFAVPCVVDGSRISAFSYTTSCMCVFQLVWLTYRFNIIDSLMQDAWVV